MGLEYKSKVKKRKEEKCNERKGREGWDKGKGKEKGKEIEKEKEQTKLREKMKAKKVDKVRDEVSVESRRKTDNDENIENELTEGKGGHPIFEGRPSRAAAVSATAAIAASRKYN